MCMSTEAPPRRTHDIRDDLDELEKMHGFEREALPDGSQIFDDGDVLLEARDFALDTGAVVCTLSIEADSVKATMRARELSVYSIGFTATSHHDPEMETEVLLK